MPKSKRREREERDDEDGQTEGEAARDYVMARAAAARVSLKAASDAIDEMIALFITPDEDGSGRTRKELADDALEAASCGVRGLEDLIENLDDCDMKAEEPWESEEA